MNRILFSNGDMPGPAMCRAPVVAFLAANATAISAGAAIIGAGASLAGAFSKPKAPNTAALTAQQQKAQKQQDALFSQQQAVTQRSQRAANDQTAALDKQLASQQAAVIARSRGNGGLQYTGPNTGLKSTLGG